MAESILKILMIAPTPYFSDRGCHVRILEEARALCKLGHNVRIASYHLGRDMSDIPVIRIANISWYSRLEAGPSWHKLYLDLLLFFKALDEILTFRPDVIHAHLHEGALIGYLLKRCTRTPLIFDYQGSLSGECIDHGFFKSDSKVAALFRRIERIINGFADRIVTSSTSGLRELTDNWSVDSSLITPVIDGVDTDVFQRYPAEDALTHLKLTLPKLPVIAYLGLMNSYQGIDLLLESILKFKRAGGLAHFLIMGFPAEKYQTMSKELGIDGMITFTGKVEYSDAPFYLSLADIALSPKLSLTEANGKLFNYMACSLPVIVFDTPVNREILGDTGIYANYADSTDFAHCISLLLADKNKLERYAGLVRNKAVTEHSWLARGIRLSKLYRELAHKYKK